MGRAVELFVALWDTLDLVPAPLSTHGALSRAKLFSLWYWKRNKASRENRSAYHCEGRLEYEIQVIGATQAVEDRGRARYQNSITVVQPRRSCAHEPLQTRQSRSSSSAKHI